MGKRYAEYDEEYPFKYKEYDVGLYDKNSLSDNVHLSVLKKYFTVCYKNRDLHIKKKEKDGTDTSEFPIHLFFSLI